MECFIRYLFVLCNSLVFLQGMWSQTTNLYGVTSVTDPCPKWGTFSCSRYFPSDSAHRQFLETNELLLARFGFPHKEFYKVEDLEHAINQFKRDHCLVMIENYQLVQLSPMKFPTLVRKPDLFWLWRQLVNTYKHPSLIWLLSSAIRNQSHFNYVSSNNYSEIFASPQISKILVRSHRSKQ